MIHIVADLGFGDSGKGAITDRIASTYRHDEVVVVRYTGGSQAGHNVVIGDKSHIHSSFAAGALGGYRSHMSAFCPIDPIALFNEGDKLQEKVDDPLHTYCSLDPLCPLITPYDQEWNRLTMGGKKDSVGMGVGAAMKRHEKTPYRLFAADLRDERMYRHKMAAIRDYYGRMRPEPSMVNERWAMEPPRIFPFIHLRNTRDVMNSAPKFILEGAQGLMLDRDHGFFPYVTYGHTSIRNAIEIAQMRDHSMMGCHYVTRSYQTRHGDGPMGGGAEINLRDETNRDDGYQGEFRSRTLDLTMLRYAYDVNQSYALPGMIKPMMHVTCMDQTPDFNLRSIHFAPRIMGWHGKDRDAQSSTITAR